LRQGVDDAERGGVEAAAFFRAGSEADPSGDHGVAQGALGVVVGRRQGGIGDEGDDGVPIVEDFAGEFANFLLVSCRLHWQFHFTRAINRLTAGVRASSPS
jgi:hypothetical protein